MLFAVVNGLSTGMSVFLVAAGLTLMFGILRILNFAHGAFFMIGAYVAFTILGSQPPSLPAFLAAAVAAGAAVGGLGLAVDRLVLRRLAGVDEHTMLIATFALLLLCHGAVKLVWGLDYVSVDPPPALDAGVRIAGLFLPRFSLFVTAAGIAVFLLLEAGLNRLWLGKLVRALAHDSWMAGLLGVNVPVGLSASVVASFALAGLAGGLLLPATTLFPELGDGYLLLAFAAVIVGGLGSVRGAFLAALLLGLADSLNALLLPDLPGLAVYLALIGFLLWKPHGMMGARAA